MSPTHWLYQQFIGDIPTGDAQCYLCGVACPGEHTVTKGIADTFNSHWLAKAPSSPWLCAACNWYLDNKVGHPDFRKMSLIVYDFQWEQWPRERMKHDIRFHLLYGLSHDAYLVCSLSKKKHILLQAPMNAASAKTLSIQVEEQVAHLDRETWEYMDRRFMALLGMGHNKGEILSGDLYSNTLRKHGQMFTALHLSQELAIYRNSPAIELLSYVTIVEKEESHESAISGDGSDSSRIAATESRVESDRPGVQGEISHGHLDASRNQRSNVRKDEQHTQQVSQQSLF